MMAFVFVAATWEVLVRQFQINHPADVEQTPRGKTAGIAFASDLITKQAVEVFQSAIIMWLDQPRLAVVLAGQEPAFEDRASDTALGRWNHSHIGPTGYPYIINEASGPGKQIQMT